MRFIAGWDDHLCFCAPPPHAPQLAVNGSRVSSLSDIRVTVVIGLEVIGAISSLLFWLELSETAHMLGEPRSVCTHARWTTFCLHTCWVNHVLLAHPWFSLPLVCQRLLSFAEWILETEHCIRVRFYLHQLKLRIPDCIRDIQCEYCGLRLNMAIDISRQNKEKGSRKKEGGWGERGGGGGNARILNRQATVSVLIPHSTIKGTNSLKRLGMAN